MITVNEYFKGKVKSLGYQSKEGKSTVGVIDKGEYKFGTSTNETMVIVEGELDVLLPGEKEWRAFKNGESFHIKAGKSFEVSAKKQVSYLCKYE